MKKQFLALLMLLSVSLVPTQASAVSVGTVAYKAAAGCVGVACAKTAFELCRDSIVYMVGCDIERIIHGERTIFARRTIQEVIAVACLTYVMYNCCKEVFASNSKKSHDGNNQENQEN